MFWDIQATERLCPEAHTCPAKDPGKGMDPGGAGVRPWVP